MYAIGMAVGGLIPTFLISRLMLWLTRSWDGGAPRLILVHTLSWIVMSFIAAMGMADGGAFAGLAAATLYAIPQGVWLTVDYIRFRHKAPRVQS